MADFVANKDGGMAEAGQENVAAPAEETKPEVQETSESETAAAEETKASEEKTEPEGDEPASSDAEAPAEGSEEE